VVSINTMGIPLQNTIIARKTRRVLPVTTSTAFRIGELINDPLNMYMSDILTISANLAGIPGISVPAGFDSAGLPIGIQVMGGHFQEKKILNTAKAIERCHGQGGPKTC